MIVVTVARKPLQEPTVAANVQAGGLGGLNIDGSRIACEGGSPTADRRESMAKPGAVMRKSSPSEWRSTRVQADFAVARPSEQLGRWPANLVLEHLPGCKETGESVVQKGTGSRDNRGTPHAAFKLDARQSLRDDFYRGIPDAHVPVWACEPGCSVKDMDEQSGESQSSGHQMTRGGKHSGSTFSIGSGNHTFASPPKDTVPGGASRFFRTIKRGK